MAEHVSNSSTLDHNQPDADPETTAILEKQWSAKLRRFGLSKLPPNKLLPDTQPEYVANWIYVFGVATLSALGVVAISGGILALEGPTWWQQSAEGRFVNSLHLWSVELFFFTMVVHLWGKFAMAAWRGRRAVTWITGVVAFLMSIGAAFTGYLSQENLDSQWISSQGKDAMNSLGIGAFFNLMNFGQMFMWHILLLPLLVAVVIGIHVLAVRVKGVVPPINAFVDTKLEAEPWKGRTRPYDIIKEGTIAFIAIGLLTVGLSITFSSPNDPPLTIKTWSTQSPADFNATVVNELLGTTTSATYGPPYNTNGPSQHFGFFSPERWIGVHIPINPAQAFVIQPLTTLTQTPTLKGAIETYLHASQATQRRWATRLGSALDSAKYHGSSITVRSGNYGPTLTMVDNLYAMARTGALDAALEHTGAFYSTDYTKPLLFMADGTYLSSLVAHDHLLGNEWGMMNETGSYPGQPWLWLYTLWYQVPPFSTSTSGDLLVMLTMGVLTLILALTPFIPGLRKVPVKLGLYKVIWKDYYRNHRTIAQIEEEAARHAVKTPQDHPL